jgi:8-oxo-dGTP pyrophosphatase MutT (NUDIX family)
MPHPSLRPLNAADLALVRTLQRELGAGETLTATRWAALAPPQQQLAEALDVAHGPANANETFALLQSGVTTALRGPRWWFHLLGLRHGAVHVILTTPQGFFVAQRRSLAKDDAPGALDVAVTGHVGLDAPLIAAWREMAEELGLTAAGSPHIIHATLHLFTEQEVEILRRAEENPPFIDREHHWIYAATLTAEGLAHLRFADGEVSSVMLLGPADLAALAQRCHVGAWRVPGEWDIAPGLMHTLPLWVAARA